MIDKIGIKWAVVAERSNSSNSGIDWTVRLSTFVYREFETRRFVFGYVYSVDREASSLTNFLYIRSLTLNVNRFVFAHAREASINIYRHTHRHTHYRSAYTLQIHRHYTLQIWSYSNCHSSEDRLLRSIWGSSSTSSTSDLSCIQFNRSYIVYVVLYVICSSI